MNLRACLHYSAHLRFQLVHFQVVQQNYNNDSYFTCDNTNITFGEVGVSCMVFLALLGNETTETLGVVSYANVPMFHTPL